MSDSLQPHGLYVACQALLPMEIYWSGVPFSIPGDLPDPGMEPESLVSPAWQAESLPPAPPEKPVGFPAAWRQHRKGRTGC